MAAVLSYADKLARARVLHEAMNADLFYISDCVKQHFEFLGGTGSNTKQRCKTCNLEFIGSGNQKMKQHLLPNICELGVPRQVKTSCSYVHPDIAKRLMSIILEETHNIKKS